MRAVYAPARKSEGAASMYSYVAVHGRQWRCVNVDGGRAAFTREEENAACQSEVSDDRGAAKSPKRPLQHRHNCMEPLSAGATADQISLSGETVTQNRRNNTAPQNHVPRVIAGMAADSAHMA